MGKIVRKTIKIGEVPSRKQIEEIEAAEKMPIMYDEDSPEFTYEEILEMVKATEEKRNGRKKEAVTIRVSADTLKKAKATGKGYTSFLSRLLENAINNKDMVARSL